MEKSFQELKTYFEMKKLFERRIKMRKLLLLVFVAVMCVPSYGSILVYKTTATATVLDTTGPSLGKVIETGYLVLSIDLTTQDVCEARQITHTGKSGATLRALSADVVFYDDVTGNIVADYSSGNNNAVLFGKTSNGKAAGLTDKNVAKSLKGYTVEFVSPFFGSGTFTATLDTKLTKDNQSTAIDTIVSNLITSLSKFTVVPDSTPPTPNPMTFLTGGEPNAVSDTQVRMTATTAIDALTPPVWYYFTNKTLTGHDSGWQESATYTDGGLSSNTLYTYTVKAKDSREPVPNETTASADANATTHAVADTTCPDPNPASFATRPTMVSDTSITMTATTATDAQGVKYYFTNKHGTGGHSSGWQTSPTYTDTGLLPDVNYGYTVKARDNALVPNVTAESNEANAVTDHDITAPDPNPATFVIAPHATGATTIAMQARIATDSSPDVYYQFYRSTIGDTSLSAWQTDSNFTDTGRTQNTTYSYQVRTKDSAVTTPVGGNIGAWSAVASATTAKTIQGQINTAIALRTGTTPVTVTIAAGTYNESIAINDPCVTLVSASGKATTIIEPGASYQQAVEVNASNVTIDGFTIKHGTQAYSVSNPEQHTIWVHDANYSTIKNCTIDTNAGNYAGIFIGGRQAGLAKTGGTPIWDYNVPSGTKGHTIQNNTFHSFIAGEGWGIFAVKLTDDSLISGNTFNGDANDMLAWSTVGNEGGVGTGILIHSATKGSGTHAVTIQNNTAAYLKYSFLTFTTEVPYNDAAGYFYTQGEHSEVNDVLVTGNTASNLGQNGIHTNGVGVTFQGKKDSSYEPNISDLTIGAGKVTITGNTFYNNQYGVRVKGPTSVLNTAYGCVLTANNILVGTNNSIYSNVTAGVYNGTIETNQDGGAVDVNAALNWWGDASGPYAANDTPKKNLYGTGNAVSDKVIYYRYWTTAAYTDPNL
jgi:hypothetical protein